MSMLALLKQHCYFQGSKKNVPLLSKIILQVLFFANLSWKLAKTIQGMPKYLVYMYLAGAITDKNILEDSSQTVKHFLDFALILPFNIQLLAYYLVSNYLEVVNFYHFFFYFSKEISKSGRKKMSKHKTEVRTVLLELGIFSGILKKLAILFQCIAIYLQDIFLPCFMLTVCYQRQINYCL